MKVSEAKDIIGRLKALKLDLEALEAYYSGNLAGANNKDEMQARAIKIQKETGIRHPLEHLYGSLKVVVDNEVDRICRIIDDADIDL